MAPKPSRSAYMTGRRKARTAAGQCARCPRPLEPGKRGVLCRLCAIKQTLEVAARQRPRREPPAVGEMRRRQGAGVFSRLGRRGQS